MNGLRTEFTKYNGDQYNGWTMNSFKHVNGSSKEESFKLNTGSSQIEQEQSILHRFKKKKADKRRLTHRTLRPGRRTVAELNLSKVHGEHQFHSKCSYRRDGTKCTSFRGWCTNSNHNPSTAQKPLRGSRFKFIPSLMRLIRPFSQSTWLKLRLVPVTIHAVQTCPTRYSKLIEVEAHLFKLWLTTLVSRGLFNRIRSEIGKFRSTNESKRIEERRDRRREEREQLIWQVYVRDRTCRKILLERPD